MADLGKIIAESEVAVGAEGCTDVQTFCRHDLQTKIYPTRAPSDASFRHAICSKKCRIFVNV